MTNGRTDGRTDRQGQILMPPDFRHGDIERGFMCCYMPCSFTYEHSGTVITLTSASELNTKAQNKSINESKEKHEIPKTTYLKQYSTTIYIESHSVFTVNFV